VAQSSSFHPGSLLKFPGDLLKLVAVENKAVHVVPAKGSGFSDSIRGSSEDPTHTTVGSSRPDKRR